MKAREIYNVLSNYAVSEGYLELGKWLASDEPVRLLSDRNETAGWDYRVGDDGEVCFRYSGQVPTSFQADRFLRRAWSWSSVGCEHARNELSEFGSRYSATCYTLADNNKFLGCDNTAELAYLRQAFAAEPWIDELCDKIGGLAHFYIEDGMVWWSEGPVELLIKCQQMRPGRFIRKKLGVNGITDWQLGTIASKWEEALDVVDLARYDIQEHAGNVSQVYYDTIIESCMTGHGNKMKLKFYDKNSDKVCVALAKDGLHEIERALVWTMPDGTRLLDRVYHGRYSDCDNILGRWATLNGIVDMRATDVRYDIEVDVKGCRAMPYMDTLCYAYKKGKQLFITNKDEGATHSMRDQHGKVDVVHKCSCCDCCCDDAITPGRGLFGDKRLCDKCLSEQLGKQRCARCRAIGHHQPIKIEGVDAHACDFCAEHNLMVCKKCNGHYISDNVHDVCLSCMLAHVEDSQASGGWQDAMHHWHAGCDADKWRGDSHYEAVYISDVTCAKCINELIEIGGGIIRAKSNMRFAIDRAYRHAIGGEGE